MGKRLTRKDALRILSDDQNLYVVQVWQRALQQGIEALRQQPLFLEMFVELKNSQHDLNCYPSEGRCTVRCRRVRALIQKVEQQMANEVEQAGDTDIFATAEGNSPEYSALSVGGEASDSESRARELHQIKRELVSVMEARDKALDALAPVERARHALAIERARLIERLERAVAAEEGAIAHYTKEGKTDTALKHDYAKSVLGKLLTDAVDGAP